MLWAFSPLLPGAAHQQSDPNAVSISEAASAAASCDAIVSYGLSQTEISTLGGVDISKGFAFPANTSANMESLSLPNETTGTVSLSYSRRQAMAPASSGSAGYSLGAHWGSAFNSIYKVNYALETGASVTATLPTATGGMAGWSSSTKGYGAGGITDAAWISVITSLVFSNETTADTSATLSVAREKAAGVFSSTGFAPFASP